MSAEPAENKRIMIAHETPFDWMVEVEKDSGVVILSQDEQMGETSRVYLSAKQARSVAAALRNAAKESDALAP